MIYINVFNNDIRQFTEITDGMDGLKRVIENNVRCFSKPETMASQTNINVKGANGWYRLIFQGENIDNVVKLLKAEHIKYNKTAFAARKRNEPV